MRFGRAPAVVLFLASICAFEGPAFAQYAIANVVIEGGAPYTDAELLTVSGLEAGQMLTHDSLANAGQHLLDTGLFDDVQVSPSGQGKTRTVHLALKPIALDKLMPASFENFVWFTPDELTQGIHARVPLYRGGAADAGNTPDAIQAALQQMLTEKGVNARLSHAVVEPSPLHPLLVLGFRVVLPAVSLADIHLAFSGPPGASAQLVPGLQKAVNEATHARYNEGLSGVTIEDRLLAPAHNAGYITAYLDHIERTVAPASNGVAVTYAARVVAGDVYKVSTLTWEPTAVYSAADLARDAKLHGGDVAAGSGLQETVGAISAAYLALGYMDVSVTATPTVDTATHTVAYTLHAVPGETYSLRILTVTGLSAEARKAFDAVWTMKPGDPYNAGVINTFIRKNIAQPAFRKYGFGYQVSADPQTHLVDLTMTFAPGAP
jgi:outer membrane protein assembly factor BamA